jgi:hypothetical protein
MVGAHVVALDADTGTVIAGTLGGWSCDAANPPTRFDGSFDLERLPVGHNYSLYAEPLVGLALPADFSDALADLCAANATPSCENAHSEHELQRPHPAILAMIGKKSTPRNKSGSQTSGAA